MKSKFFFSVSAVMLFCIMVLVYIVDPYFHFHKPIQGLAYLITNQRYVNDGIGRHFEYDAVITGNSMIENFMVSDFDYIFKKKSVKLPYSGGSYYEISTGLSRLIERNDKMNCVLWGLDFQYMDQEWNYKKYRNYPEYLYDEDVFNDISYLLSKNAIAQTVRTIARTLQGLDITTMDEYSSWQRENGKNKVLAYYNRPQEKKESGIETIERINYQQISENINKNLVSIVEKNPQIEFMFFIAPYSIVWWDQLNQNDLIECQMEKERLLLEALLRYDNVKIYCFFDQTEAICNLDNYADIIHYSEEINSMILRWIEADIGRITLENVEHHLCESKKFFENYNYDLIFEEN